MGNEILTISIKPDDVNKINNYIKHLEDEKEILKKSNIGLCEIDEGLIRKSKKINEILESMINLEIQRAKLLAIIVEQIYEV
ncbi:MAG: hypothetical protein HFJ13_08080 [Clostridium sp.]|jgi:hypothetical protein|uniref:hypothetical protein n=1 Tax=Clostridium sp. TaxID=1506 RepID=UPI0025B8C480|nr:hypothetical protein [Clostridium sp.]MCI9070556.1 hypothetical protein [Clostridium sp.]MCI9304055.1 hypothetical protein [Clostridium sp.]